MNANSNKQFDDHHLELVIKKILQKHNLLFPTNETEFGELMILMDKVQTYLPKELDDPSNIFKESARRYVSNSYVQAGGENFSLAARNGGKISKEQLELILNKIKLDRAENESGHSK